MRGKEEEYGICYLRGSSKYNTGRISVRFLDFGKL
jgi:hypothetical protein